MTEIITASPVFNMGLLVALLTVFFILIHKAILSQKNQVLSNMLNFRSEHLKCMEAHNECLRGLVPVLRDIEHRINMLEKSLEINQKLTDSKLKDATVLYPVSKTKN